MFMLDAETNRQVRNLNYYPITAGNAVAVFFTSCGELTGVCGGVTGNLGGVVSRLLSPDAGASM
jgi:hypothetical protein